MNYFIYLFTETILTSKWILWSCILVGFALCYIFIIRFYVSRTLATHGKKKFFPNKKRDRKTLSYFEKNKFFFSIFNKNNQIKKMVVQLPAFLQALSSSLQAGYSIQKAFLFLEQEIENPLKNEIQKINNQLSLHIPLEKVLSNFAQKINNPEIYFFTESTIIQLKTGGNLVNLFNKISTLIEEKLKLQRDIKSFTSQGKLSGIFIACLCPISLLFFYFFSPSHMEILLHSSAGNFLLGFSILLESIGFFFIWKIVKIKL